MRTLLISSAIAFAPLALAVEAQNPASSYPPVALARTQLRVLPSKHVPGQTFEIRIWVPEEYQRAADRFPVVYLLDGDLLFGTATEVAQPLQWGGLLPPVIIVGIGYGSIHGPANGGTNMRGRDMSVFTAQSGYVADGGARFLSFMRDELIPYIDREFRTDTSDRTLAGFSRGADFTVYAMFTAPERFRRFVIIDSYFSDYVKLAEGHAASGKDLPKRISISHRIPGGPLQDFAELLRSRFPSADVRFHAAEPRHVAAGPAGITRGLQAVFNKASVYEALLPVARDRGIADAIAEYRRLKSADKETYNFAEMELVELGNALVTMKRPAEAIELYRLNLESYPRSARTHSRLGATHERTGNKVKALEHFRRAVELDPGDRNAADAVKRLESP